MSEANYFSQSKILQHSFSTPITNILLNAELASKTGAFSSTKPNYFYHLDQILLSARYLSSILKLADDDRKIMQEQFSPKKAVQEIIIIAKKPNESTNLISHFNIPDSVMIYGNKFYFQEAIICILNNAFESYHQNFHNKPIIMVVSYENKSIAINISDGGRGMSWIEKQKVFLTHYSHKNNHLGVGLKFAKNIFCKNFHGSLKIISEKNKGTTIQILIPIIQDHNFAQ